MEIGKSENENIPTPTDSKEAVQAEDSLRKRQADVQKILSKNCKQHPEKKANHLHLASNSPNIRICQSCVQEQEVKAQEYLQIEDALNATRDTFLIFYPVLKDSDLRKTIKRNVGTVDKVKGDIFRYLEDLRKLINEKIDNQVESQKLNINKLFDLFNEYMDCFKEVTNIKQLQTIFFEQVDSEDSLMQFVNNHIENSEANTQRIKELYGKFEAMNLSFSENQPAQIQKLVCSLLEEITFFDSPEVSLLKAVQQRDEYQAKVQHQQKELEDSLQQLNLCKSQSEEDQNTIQQQKLLIEEYKIRLEKMEHDKSVQLQTIQEKNETNTQMSQKICQLEKQIQEDNQQITSLKDQSETQNKSTQGLNQQINELNKQIQEKKQVN